MLPGKVYLSLTIRNEKKLDLRSLWSTNVCALETWNVRSSVPVSTLLCCYTLNTNLNSVKTVSKIDDAEYFIFVLLKWDVSLKWSFVPDMRVMGLVQWYVSMSSPKDRAHVKGKIWINEWRNTNHDSVILLGAFCRNILDPSVASKRGVTVNQHSC